MKGGHGGRIVVVSRMVSSLEVFDDNVRVFLYTVAIDIRTQNFEPTHCKIHDYEVDKMWFISHRY